MISILNIDTDGGIGIKLIPVWWDQQRVASCQLGPVQLQYRHVRAKTPPFASRTAHFAPPPAPLLRSVVVPSCDSTVGRAAVRETRSADD